MSPLVTRRKNSSCQLRHATSLPQHSRLTYSGAERSSGHHVDSVLYIDIGRVVDSVLYIDDGCGVVDSILYTDDGCGVVDSVLYIDGSRSNDFSSAAMTTTATSTSVAASTPHPQRITNC